MADRRSQEDTELRTSLAAVRSRLPVLVFAGVMLLAAVVSRQLSLARESAEEAQVQSASHAMLEEMQLRLNAYEVMLRSTASFISNRPEFDRDAFSGFITSQSIRESFPGVLAIGYATWDGSTVPPKAIVRYVEPAQVENARVLGFDLMSEPSRRQAIDACLATSEPVATAPVTLSQDKGNPESGPGVVLFAPVRAEPLDHTSQVRGIAFLSFRTKDFFRAILASSPPITFSVTDGAVVLGGLPPIADQSGNLRTTEREVLVAGRAWVFRGWKNVGFEGGIPTGYGIYGIGLIVATILSLTVSREIRGRREAEEMAERVATSERAAASSEERYRLFVAQSSEAIWRFECASPLGADGSTEERVESLLHDATVEECNAAFALMCGYDSPDGLLGKALVQVFPHAAWPREFLSEFVQNGYRVNGFESEEGQGASTRIHLHSLVGVVEDGALLRGWGVVRSVTTERLAQREILQLNLELEDRVNARTAELHEANKEMEAFTYTVSHDLRSPLRTMAGFGRILRDDYGERLDDEGKTLLGRIESAAVRLSQLIDALLGYSRLARVSMEVSHVDVSAVAERIAEEMRDLRSDPVIVRVESGLTAEADPALLEILLANLLSNAFKFTSRTENPAIEVGKEGEEFFVRDNGAGFDPAFSQRLFRAFERLHNEREFPGTGIGLASVERIVRRHHGTIRAVSEVGQGASFYFTLGSGADKP